MWTADAIFGICAGIWLVGTSDNVAKTWFVTEPQVPRGWAYGFTLSDTNYRRTSTPSMEGAIMKAHHNLEVLVVVTLWETTISTEEVQTVHQMPATYNNHVRRMGER